MKQCNECLKFKSLSEFAVDKRQSDGLFGKCRACHNARQNEQRKIKKQKKVVEELDEFDEQPEGYRPHPEGYYERFKKYKK